MKVGQLCGHSCLRIWTNVRLSLDRKTRSFRATSSLDDTVMTLPTT